MEASAKDLNPEEKRLNRARFTIAWADRTGRSFELVLGKRTLFLGILNVTPNSFYDGGRYLDPLLAEERALALQEEGADIIDIGGESTRPGSLPLSVEEELKRVLPVMERVAGKLKVPVSIDTYKAEVARRALEAGAQIVNDISALRFDPRMPEVVSSASGPLILMHMKGTPREMQKSPAYKDILGEIKDFFRQRLRQLASWGIGAERAILDPGIGFGKTLEHNLRILAGLPSLADLGRPLLVGPSRKSFIGAILGLPEEERLWGTAGAVAAAIRGGAHLVRVHDVRKMREVAAVVDRIMEMMGTGSC